MSSSVSSEYPIGQRRLPPLAFSEPVSVRPRQNSQLDTYRASKSAPSPELHDPPNPDTGTRAPVGQDHLRGQPGYGPHPSVAFRSIGPGASHSGNHGSDFRPTRLHSSYPEPRVWPGLYYSADASGWSPHSQTRNGDQTHHGDPWQHEYPPPFTPPTCTRQNPGHSHADSPDPRAYADISVSGRTLTSASDGPTRHYPYTSNLGPDRDRLDNRDHGGYVYSQSAFGPGPAAGLHFSGREREFMGREVLERGSIPHRTGRPAGLGWVGPELDHPGSSPVFLPEHHGVRQDMARSSGHGVLDHWQEHYRVSQDHPIHDPRVRGWDMAHPGPHAGGIHMQHPGMNASGTYFYPGRGLPSAGAHYPSPHDYPPDPEPPAGSQWSGYYPGAGPTRDPDQGWFTGTGKRKRDCDYPVGEHLDGSPWTPLGDARASGLNAQGTRPSEPDALGPSRWKLVVRNRVARADQAAGSAARGRGGGVG
mmetsp:Transcript_21566/g.50756  ORF Transcript_21566/g.50756 Transcript_21566/m.50756 type:complete len:476 (-) Transcript_21566:43-1470(-)